MPSSIMVPASVLAAEVTTPEAATPQQRGPTVGNKPVEQAQESPSPSPAEKPQAPGPSPTASSLHLPGGGSKGSSSSSGNVSAVIYSSSEVAKTAGNPGSLVTPNSPKYKQEHDTKPEVSSLNDFDTKH